MSEEEQGQDVIDLTGPTAMSNAARAEIDIQIATAHAYPRIIGNARKTALALATMTTEIAAQMGYALPRGGKTITGISIRLAEIMASSWGNLRYGSRLVGQDNSFVHVEGFCHDLESNSAVCIPVSRRITNKYGKKFTDDMIQTTIQAAASLALRNAILRIVPRAYAEDVYQKAMDVAYGSAYALAEKRRDALTFFAGLGAPEAWVLAALGRSCEEEITREDMQILGGYKNAMDEGATTIGKLFPDPEADEKAAAKTEEKTGLDALTEEANKKKGGEPTGNQKTGSAEEPPPTTEKPKGRRRTHELKGGGKSCGAGSEQIDRLKELAGQVGEDADGHCDDYLAEHSDLDKAKWNDLTWLTTEEASGMITYLEQHLPIDADAPADEPTSEPEQKAATEPEPETNADAPPFAVDEEVLMFDGKLAKVLAVKKGATGKWVCDLARVEDGEAFNSVGAAVLKKA